MAKFCVFKGVFNENGNPIAINPKRVEVIWFDGVVTRIKINSMSAFAVGESFEAVLDKLRWGPFEVRSSPQTPRK